MNLILLYHSISEDKNVYSITKEDFDKQVFYFQKKFKVVSLMELLDIIKKGGGVRGDYGAINFDDGYRDNLINALPVLEKYNLPATIFVSASLAGKVSDNKKLLNWDEVRELSNHKLIDIGSHGMEHEMYDKLNKDEVLSKMIESKKIIESEIGKNVDFFAFPKGKNNEASIELIDNQYLALFSSSGPINFKKYNINSLPRVTISKKIKFTKFKFILSGHYWMLKKIKIW